MTKQQLNQTTALEGRQVNIILADGSRINDCQLVSSGRNRAWSLWVFTNGIDVFIPLDTVRDVSETPTDLPGCPMTLEDARQLEAAGWAEVGEEPYRQAATPD